MQVNIQVTHNETDWQADTKVTHTTKQTDGRADIQFFVVVVVISKTRLLYGVSLMCSLASEDIKQKGMNVPVDAHNERKRLAGRHTV